MKLRSFVLMFIFSALTEAATPLSVQQVAPGIYVHFETVKFPDRHNHGAIANIGFIVGDSCVAVIDTGGHPKQGYALKQVISEITDTPVCYVINTHVHPDHINGNSAFKSPGVHFIGHHKLARAMAVRGDFYIDRAQDQLDIKLSAKDIIPPDMPVKKHMTINLGNRELVLTAHPTAHTDNDLTVYDRKTDTLWLSDLLFIDHVPTLDGSIKGWLKEIQRLEKHDYRHVIPGHGPLVTDWPAAIQPQKNYLNQLVTEIRARIRQGEFLEEAVKTVGLSAKKDWKLFDQYHLKNVTAAFAELEWED